MGSNKAVNAFNTPQDRHLKYLTMPLVVMESAFCKKISLCRHHAIVHGRENVAFIDQVLMQHHRGHGFESRWNHLNSLDVYNYMQ